MEVQQRIIEKTKDAKLSDLPNDILTNILNLLSAKEALMACAVNRTCRNLWKDISSIILQYSNLKMCTKLKMDRTLGDLCDQMKNFLDALNASVDKKEFQLVLEWSSDVKESDFEKLDTLVRWALKEHVELLKLNLELGYDGTVLYPIPSFLFDSESLRKLEIRGSRVNISNLKFSFPLLVALKLSKMKLNTSNLSQLIYSCPLLEDLNTEECRFRNFLDNDASALQIVSGTIKHLTVWKCYVKASVINSIVIDLPAIEKASINMFCSVARQIQALNDLKTAESIHVGYRCIEAVSRNAVELFPNLKLAELEPSLTCPRLLSGISSLLTAFSTVSTLVISFKAHRGRWNMFLGLESPNVLQKCLGKMINLHTLSMRGIEDTEIMVIVSNYKDRDTHHLPVVASATMKFGILETLVQGLSHLKKLEITVGVLGSRYFSSEDHLKNDALKLFEGIASPNVLVTVSLEPLILTGSAKGKSACLLE